MIRGFIHYYNPAQASIVKDMYLYTPLKRPLTDDEYWKIQNLFFRIYNAAYPYSAYVHDPIFLPLPAELVQW